MVVTTAKIRSVWWKCLINTPSTLLSFFTAPANLSLVSRWPGVGVGAFYDSNHGKKTNLSDENVLSRLHPPCFPSSQPLLILAWPGDQVPPWCHAGGDCFLLIVWLPLQTEELNLVFFLQLIFFTWLRTSKGATWAKVSHRRQVLSTDGDHCKIKSMYQVKMSY